MARQLYGLAEIAETLGLTRQAVTVWRKRRSWDMPEPDVELASGPVWHSGTIEPWLQTQRSRLADGTDTAALSASDIKRAGRRLLRLLVLLLEEPPRANLIQQALNEVNELAEHVARAADDDSRARLAALLEPVTRSATEWGELTRLLVDALPGLHDVLGDVVSDPSGDPPQ